MLLKEVLLFCGFKLLPDFCKLPFSFPALSSVFKDLSDIWEMLCLFSPLSSFSNLTSECVCPRVRRLRCCTNHRSVFLTTNQSQLLLPAPPLALATSSELSDSPLSTISGVCQPAEPLPRPGPELLVSRVSQFLLVWHLANN